MPIADAAAHPGSRTRGWTGLLAGSIGLAVLAGGQALAGPLVPVAPAAPASFPLVRSADCAGSDCAAPVILVQEGGLLGRMREWRGERRIAPRREIRQRASYERRSSRRSRSSAEQRPRDRSAPTYARGGGTFTTMCVRSCDGYFFPISFSTTEDRFAADQMACQARCPGMEVSLFVHKVIGETSDQMRSVAGTPYSDLTNAFLYKLKGPSDPATCGCRIPAPVLQAAPLPAEEPSKTGVTPALWTVPLPNWRPDPNAVAAIETATAIADAAPKAIRVVGPAFYPDQ